MKIKNNKIIADASNGDKYVFHIVDEETLEFIQEESSEIKQNDIPNAAIVEDGSKFILQK